ncbi:hypothetical protein D3C83_253550 [compost metagenome]
MLALVGRGRCFALEQLDEAVDMANGGAQVVGDCVGESVQLRLQPVDFALRIHEPNTSLARRLQRRGGA